MRYETVLSFRREFRARNLNVNVGIYVKKATRLPVTDTLYELTILFFLLVFGFPFLFFLFLFA